MAGGLGAKKVDVTWATEEAGLLLAISIKSINFRDSRTGNYQKNLVNRRGDMLMEAVTLHRRFPYAVLAAVVFFDKGAEHDGTGRRKSTFVNAHARLKLFTGRSNSSAFTCSCSMPRLLPLLSAPMRWANPTPHFPWTRLWRSCCR